MREQPLTSTPIARDIIPRITRLNVHVNIWHPATVKGIRYGICHPVYEELPVLAELDNWLANLPLLRQMTLRMEWDLLWLWGYSLGIKWEWLFERLEPLKEKYDALKVIGFADSNNRPDGTGFCWAFKDAETGIWSGLRLVDGTSVTMADWTDDLKKANVNLL